MTSFTRNPHEEPTPRISPEPPAKTSGARTATGPWADARPATTSATPGAADKPGVPDAPHEPDVPEAAHEPALTGAAHEPGGARAAHEPDMPEAADEPAQPEPHAAHSADRLTLPETLPEPEPEPADEPSATGAGASEATASPAEAHLLAPEAERTTARPATASPAEDDSPALEAVGTTTAEDDPPAAEPDSTQTMPLTGAGPDSPGATDSLALEAEGTATRPPTTHPTDQASPAHAASAHDAGTPDAGTPDDDAERTAVWPDLSDAAQTHAVPAATEPEDARTSELATAEADVAERPRAGASQAAVETDGAASVAAASDALTGEKDLAATDSPKRPRRITRAERTSSATAPTAEQAADGTAPTAERATGGAAPAAERAASGAAPAADRAAAEPATAELKGAGRAGGDSPATEEIDLLIEPDAAPTQPIGVREAGRETRETVRIAVPERESAPPPDERPFWMPVQEMPRGSRRPPMRERPGRPPKAPRRPATGLVALLVLALVATFFAWVSAEPLWLAVGHGDEGTATVTECTGDGVSQRCLGEFTAASGAFTAERVRLLGVGDRDGEGTTVAAKMVAPDSGRAYVDAASGVIHLRWALGMALVLLCGVGIVWATGSLRLETRRARRRATLAGLAGPVLVAIAFLAATF
ncbi:hypothetical protein [Phytohabitans houttuyneae]